MHQAEEYIKNAVGELSRGGYLQDFLRQEKDKAAIAPIAEQVRKFSETMLEPQQIKIIGFAVPIGSLALYGYVQEEYIKNAVGELSRGGYLQDFLRQEKDKAAIAPIAEQVRKFSETMLEPQQIKIIGFAVPIGSLALYGYVQEELSGLRQMLAVGDSESAALMPEKQRVQAEKRPTVFAALTAAEKEDMAQRFTTLSNGVSHLTEQLLAQHVADQLTQRIEAEAAAKAMQESGYLPLHLDETTMGRVVNTAALQLCIDRFNLLFQGIAEPVSQELIKTLLAKHLLPFWQEHGDGILFRMEEA